MIKNFFPSNKGHSLNDHKLQRTNLVTIFERKYKGKVTHMVFKIWARQIDGEISH